MPDNIQILVKNSILQSTKKLLGIAEDYEAFDLDIITHINSAFSVLKQVGVGPEEGYAIEGPDDSWDSFTGSKPDLAMVKSYIFLKVQSLFDSNNTPGPVLDSRRKIADEYEWRLQISEDRPIFLVNPPADPYPDNGIDDDMLYNLTGNKDFPASAPSGALGVDLESGKVYRNL